MSVDLFENVLAFTPCGLVLDACGVVLLGMSFFLKDAGSMIEESGTTWNSDAYKTVAVGKSDGIFGTLLLFLGFIYQVFGYVGFGSVFLVGASYVLLAAFLVVYASWLREFYSNTWVQKIEDTLRNRGG